MRPWFKRFAYWTYDGCQHWIGVLVVAFVALSICLVFGPSERSIRVAGLILQLLGISSVVVGIQQTRELFGRPPFSMSAWHWLKRFPWGQTVIRGSGASVMPAATVRGYGSSWTNPKDDSIEARIAALEENVRRVDQHSLQLNRLLDDEVRDRKASVRHEEQERKHEDHSTRQKLELSETGGLQLSLTGAVWIGLGVILSTIPNEILGLFN